VLGGTGLAQIPMPDAREMSGIPRPVTDLPDGTVSVRLIRGDLSNNLPDQEVELQVDGQSQAARTGEDGRAQFGPLPPGALVRASATVDGERLESQAFPAPRQGGIRLLLVATDPARAAQAPPPSEAGTVPLGGETCFVIEAGDETVRVFYLLDIVNGSPGPVEPPDPFMFDTPTGALSTTVMQGSSPQATATGTRVRVQGPFPPGTTSVQIGFALPAPRGHIEIEQRFPAPLEHVGVLVEKVGADVSLSSPQVARQQEMPVAGQTYIAAAGGALPAGEALTLEVSGLPHHSIVPRTVALGLAGAVLLAGIWALRRPVAADPAGRRRRLVAQREELFQELIRLERDRTLGRVEEGRYAASRERMLQALEDVYAALDPDSGPGPADRAGAAA
jgi:hypothetical protein